MQRSKVVCINCPHCKNCSITTRLYVNYCGPRTKSLKSHISKAHAECRTHRGIVFKFNILMSPLKIAEAKKYIISNAKK